MPTVHHAIDVAATPDDCWRVFSDLSTWTRWFPMLQRVDGELRSGGKLTLRFAAGPTSLPVDVAIEEYKPSELVRWVGGRLGVRGDHAYSFAVSNPGLTRVTSRECFSGFGARLITGPIFAKLDNETHQSMERFKALVEAAKKP
ncbi:MAG: cyclase/dehydrase [bacterium]|nr:cyclase/dehydrase [bacterium]